MNKIAIIGLGPRGLYALEMLIQALSLSNNEIEIYVFEESNEPGSGSVWFTDQPDSNWMNITERALEGLKLRPRINYANIGIDEFPSYHEWADFSQTSMVPDVFPPRNQLGKYLKDRFETLRNALQRLDSFKTINQKVKQINFENNLCSIQVGDDTLYFDDVLLTIGHQLTKVSDQLAEWTSYAKNKKSLYVFEDLYPVKQFAELRNKTNITIGIRGFGLAMIDAMRYLAINDFGNFKVVDNTTLKSVYYKVNQQNLKLIPFSLDGLPLGPKPINEHIDNLYKPTTSELNTFSTIVQAVAQKKSTVNDISFLIEPIAKIAARVFIDLKEKAVKHEYNSSEIEHIIFKFLDSEAYDHLLLQDQSVTTYELIENYIAMALGKSPASLDYCVWQVWRHCQPSLYKSFSHAKVKDEIVESVINLDERSKRFSYGPPVESMQQILALVDADILSLDFTKDPEIELSDNGWKLTNNKNQTITTTVMINSVLDAPKLLNVKSKIIKTLLQDDVIQPIHSKLGIETTEDGYVVTQENVDKLNLAILGRLAKGSVIGVDAILECFGPRIETWSKAYVDKL
ncbi:FAD/NAD(P)-binding protein [uncultured Winogradskyella sp.]|uniref:FAD/NAD(P)-binding protein n=1 Tax=uncultured Winogradskyella sp. TaxID=395353 RepID=UPI002615798B|nr:FAD/NAD(P)-binding protein [uncultured Winogradskyella sp.]